MKFGAPYTQSQNLFTFIIEVTRDKEKALSFSLRSRLFPPFFYKYKCLEISPHVYHSGTVSFDV